MSVESLESRHCSITSLWKLRCHVRPSCEENEWQKLMLAKIKKCVWISFWGFVSLRVNWYQQKLGHNKGDFRKFYKYKISELLLILLVWLLLNESLRRFEEKEKEDKAGTSREREQSLSSRRYSFPIFPPAKQVWDVSTVSNRLLHCTCCYYFVLLFVISRFGCALIIALIIDCT